MPQRESPLIQLSNQALTPWPLPIPQQTPFMKMGNPKLIAFQLGDEGRFSEFLDLILEEEQYF